MAEPPADPHGTAALRAQLLAIWRAAPARFREDANAEEDLALGGYRDRLVIELAANAADAAVRAGVPGRLLLSLRDHAGYPVDEASGEGRRIVGGAPSGSGSVLAAANTGAALDDAGVLALASLRASSKRDDDPGQTTGRLGVGFASVLAVTDEPVVCSRHGGVRFSADETREAVRAAAQTVPELAAELDRRGGHVPVLRLPYEAEAAPPDGYDTVVLLPLRDGAARDLVVSLLHAVDDALLLALPALREVVIEVPDAPTRRIADIDRRWHVLRCGGFHRPADLADRPTEERARRAWSVTWGLPREADRTVGTFAGHAPVVYAPTPTDEPLPWPAVLVATLPLDVTRRHIAAGRATDVVLEQAAEAYAELLGERALAGDDVLPLVPVGAPSGVVDAALRAAVLPRLAGTALLPGAGGLVRPRDAVVVDGVPAGAAVAALAEVVDGLTPDPGDVTALRALTALGVRRRSLADVIDEVPEGRDPHWYRDLYDVLAGVTGAGGRAGVDPGDLGSLPVPLADGQVVRGPRGLLLPEDGAAALPAGALSRLAPFGLRVVHPLARHDLLRRLGARPASARAVLTHASVRDAVAGSPEDDDPASLAEAVLALVEVAVGDERLGAGDLPWLADLGLPDADGELVPAGALALPGSLAAQVMDTTEIGLLDEALVRRWGPDVLRAVGVLDSLSVVRAGSFIVAGDPEPVEVPEALLALPQVEVWLEEVRAVAGGAVELTEVAALCDLDAVRRPAWAQVLEAVSVDPTLRRTLLEPVRVLTERGPLHRPSYSAWWLRRYGPWRAAVRAADGEPALRSLLDDAPPWAARLDAHVSTALGVVRRIEDLDAAALPVLLERLADEDREITVPALLRVWAVLAGLDTPRPASPPARVRALVDSRATVVAAERAVVLDSPMWRARHDLGGHVVVATDQAEALADLLDLPLASEVAAGRVEPEDADRCGQWSPVPASARDVLPAAPEHWCHHRDLRVDGVSVRWWVTDQAQGEVHAVDLAGLACGLAQLGGAWSRRWLVERWLAGGGDGALVGELVLDSLS